MGFLVGIIRIQRKEIFFFFLGMGFLMGMVTDFVTLFLILIVKVHKIS